VSAHRPGPADPADPRAAAALEDAGGFGSLHELYGEVILDHNRRPRNYGRLPAASHCAVGHNPLCGDRVAVYLRVEGGRIEEIGFEGVGCAISTASASMMTEALRGRSLAEAQQLFTRFHALLTADQAGGADPGCAPELGKLAVFAGVREFPMRVKCATLAWHALKSALASTAPCPAPPAAAPGPGREASPAASPGLAKVVDG
jgi:nitrogen fixation NifU-like protein